MIFGQAQSTVVRLRFPFSNAVGLYLAPIIMLLVGNLGRLWKSGAKFITNEWQYLATIFGIMLGLGAVAAARSEGAIFALAIGFVLFGLFSQKNSGTNSWFNYCWWFDDYFYTTTTTLHC